MAPEHRRLLRVDLASVHLLSQDLDAFAVRRVSAGDFAVTGTSEKTAEVFR